MSKYLRRTSSCSPSTATRTLVERYRDDPAGTVAWWEREQANQLLNSVAGEASTWLRSPTPSATRWSGTTTSRCSRWARIRS